MILVEPNKTTEHTKKPELKHSKLRVIHEGILYAGFLTLLNILIMIVML